MARRFQAVRKGLKISRGFANRPTHGGTTVLRALGSWPDRDVRGLLLRWVANAGPFIEDGTLQDGVFEFSGIDLSDSGLEYAAKLELGGYRNLSFSFSGGMPDFSAPELLVECLTDDGLTDARVSNTIDPQELEKAGEEAQEPASTWTELLDAASGRYPNLIISERISEKESALMAQPFDRALSDGFDRLMTVLNQIAGEILQNGREAGEYKRLVKDFFTGEKAPFSPESDSNKRDFKDELTFPDPSDPQKEIFADWHGKISHRFFRLHFEWPMPENQDGIKVLYFGPKITKG